MATTTTVTEIDLLKGPSDSKRELRAYRVRVRIVGTYDSAGRPAFDFLAALQAAGRQGVTGVTTPARGAVCFGDYINGSTRYTVPNANITLGGTGNKDITLQLHSGAQNGAAGAEIADATAVDGEVDILVVTDPAGK
jgi:hypothetical protein